jgi:hypothetical protein
MKVGGQLQGPATLHPWYPVGNGLDGSPKSQSGHGGKDENKSLTPPWRELKPGRPARSLVANRLN